MSDEEWVTAPCRPRVEPRKAKIPANLLDRLSLHGDYSDPRYWDPVTGTANVNVEGGGGQDLVQLLCATTVRVILTSPPTTSSFITYQDS